jgi:hypothetical protein
LLDQKMSDEAQFSVDGTEPVRASRQYDHLRHVLWFFDTTT